MEFFLGNKDGGWSKDSYSRMKGFGFDTAQSHSLQVVIWASQLT